MTSEEIQAFGTEYTAAWNSGDQAAVAGFFETSGSLKVNDAEPAVGRESEAGRVSRSLGHFDEAEYNRQIEVGIEGD